MSRRARTRPSDGEGRSSASAVTPAPTHSTPGFTTGCTLLDMALGGRGWALGRVINVVGDKSTGKTLLAIEACANYTAGGHGDRVVYAESEAAFDKTYAATLGLPLANVEFPEVFTVEDIFEDIEKRLEDNEPTLYVIDSMDALSDRKEQERGMDEGTFGTKPKKISEWFRRQNARMKRSSMTLMIISQIRDNIGVTFGAKHTRSGGKALDFYASQVVWLAHMGKIERTRKKVKRAVGVNIKAQVKKCKVGVPFREAEFPIIFGYGVEDVEAGLAWLISVGRTDTVGLSEADAKKLVSKLERLSADEYKQTQRDVSAAVRVVWDEVEADFQPTRSKYG